MAVTTGAEGTGATLGILAARRVVYMADRMFELEPQVNPLTLLLRKAGKKSVFAPKYEELSHERIADTTQSSAAEGAGDTTIAVDDGSVGAANMLCQNQRTGETIRIGAVSSNDWTGCTRSVGTVAAAAINVDDAWITLGTSFAENSAAPDPRQKQADAGFNYTQIARDVWGASGTLMATNVYPAQGKPIMSERAAQRDKDHRAGIEKSLFFGERSEVTSGDYPIRTVGGMDEFANWSYDFAGSFSMQEAFDALETGMFYGSNSKWLFASVAASSNISLEALDKVRKVDSDKSFGIAINKLISPHGTVNIVAHKLFRNTQYGTRAYLIDMANVKYVVLAANGQNRDTALYEGIETNGTDGMEHGWLTEYGLERRLAKTHQVWTNVASDAPAIN